MAVVTCRQGWDGDSGDNGACHVAGLVNLPPFSEGVLGFGRAEGGLCHAWAAIGWADGLGWRVAPRRAVASGGDQEIMFTNLPTFLRGVMRCRGGLEMAGGTAQWPQVELPGVGAPLRGEVPAPAREMVRRLSST